MNKFLKSLGNLSGKAQCVLGEHNELLDAYLYRSRVKCGRPTCKCMLTNYRHENWCISFRENDRSRTITVPDEWLDRVRAATESYREARAISKEFNATCQAAVASLDELIDGHVNAGRTMVAELLACKTQRKHKVRIS